MGDACGAAPRVVAIDPVRIELGRITLRELEEDDLASVQAWAGDPEVSRYMEWGPNDEDDTRAFLAYVAEARAARPRRTYELGIELRESGALVGAAGVRVRDAEARSGDLGYVLRRDRWGRGYATEAGRALVVLAHEGLGLHRVWATCRPQNRASARVLEKLGMRCEGRLRHEKRVRGEWVDSLLYARIDGD